jgi:hypothetical protein
VFYQIPEMGTVEVLGHSLTPRNAQPPQATQPAPVAPEERPIPKKPKRQPAVPPPPPPPTPALPADWIERSKSAIPPEPAVVPEPPKTAPVRLEDWSLVRTSQGRVGWALTRMLTMAIPDEVAQYAEGHRITSYFSLGEVRDGELRKHHWLWTTHSEWAQPYQFDSFRVFIWSIRRHRYETAYIERDVRGYFPVEVHTVEVTENRKPVKQPAFTLILETEDGSKVRKTYAFQPHRVRLVSKAPYQEPVRQQQQLLAQAKAPEKSEAEPSLGNRFLDSVRGWKKRLLGR